MTLFHMQQVKSILSLSLDRSTCIECNQKFFFFLLLLSTGNESYPFSIVMVLVLNNSNSQECHKFSTLLDFAAKGLLDPDYAARAASVGYAALPPYFYKQTLKAFATFNCSGHPAFSLAACINPIDGSVCS